MWPATFLRVARQLEIFTVRRDLLRVVQDDDGDFPASLRLVQNVCDACALQFLPLRLYRIATPVTNVALALSELTDPTLSSLRPKRAGNLFA